MRVKLLLKINTIVSYRISGIPTLHHFGRENTLLQTWISQSLTNTRNRSVCPLENASSSLRLESMWCPYFWWNAGLNHGHPRTEDGMWRSFLLQTHKDAEFHCQSRVTSLGVLFDFTGNAVNTTVQNVEDMVKEKWVLCSQNPWPTICWQRSQRTVRRSYCGGTWFLPSNWVSLHTMYSWKVSVQTAKPSGRHMPVSRDNCRLFNLYRSSRV